MGLQTDCRQNRNILLGDSLSILRCTTPEHLKTARLFVNNHHSYIKWSDRPSRKMYWLLYEGANVVGVFGLGSAFALPKSVAGYMKVHNLCFNEVGNNIVYALWGATAENTGTQFLKLIRRDAVLWWKEKYGDSLKALQTFILPPRTGALYKADNWKELGTTTGGKALTIRTLPTAIGEKHPKAEKRIFRSGKVRYLVREFRDTTPKLIFMKLL